MTVSAIRHVNPALFHDWTWLDMSSSDEDEDAQVTVELRIHTESYAWSLMCVQGSTLLHNGDGYSDPWARRPSIICVLEEIRRCFARHDAEPGGTMEVPSSLQEWRSFISLWLFSKAIAPQATLARWLSPRQRQRRAMPRMWEARRARPEAFRARSGQSLLLQAMCCGLHHVLMPHCQMGASLLTLRE